MGKRVCNLSRTASDADLIASMYLLLDGVQTGAKKLPANLLASVAKLREAMRMADTIGANIKPRIFGTNWFDESDLIEGYYIDYETGRQLENPEYTCTGFTPIEAEATYYAKNTTSGDQIAFYDVNLQYIGGVVLGHVSSTEFVTPPGTRFARYCTETTNLVPFYIVKDDSIMWKDPYHFRGWFENTEIVVAQDGSGDFTSLTEAATYAVSGDVIHVKAGVYDNEAVQLFGKDVAVYGDGCLSTIIMNGWNTYSKAPIEMATGVLRDIMAYAYDGGSPSQDPTGNTAYAMHVDSDMSYGKSFIVERCVFISDRGNNAVGVGIYGGCDFIFRDCQFIGGISTPFYIHDSTNPQYVGIMDLELYNNTFISNGNGAFGIDNARLEGTSVYITACNNNFQDLHGPTPQLFAGNILYPPDDQPGPAEGNTNIHIPNWNTKSLNNGNNLAILNGAYVLRPRKFEQTYSQTVTLDSARFSNTVSFATTEFMEFLGSALITSPTTVKLRFTREDEGDLETGSVDICKKGVGGQAGVFLGSYPSAKVWGPSEDSLVSLFGNSISDTFALDGSSFDSNFSGFEISFNNGGVPRGATISIYLTIICNKLE